MVRMRVHILDLPYDILAILFTELDPKDFLSFCSTCSELYEHVSDLDLWRRVTQSTFRLPNRPSAQYDGERWKSLYRRLKHESQIYLWGQHRRTRQLLNDKKDRAHLNIFQYPLSEHPLSSGVIVDMQIGGWSTTVLDSAGVLYTSGPLYSERRHEIGSEYFVSLQFPTPGSSVSLASTPSEDGQDLASISTLPNPGPIAGGAVIPEGPYTIQSTSSPTKKSIEESEKRSTTIKRFSAGRGHVLGLADDSTTWLWHRASKPAIKLEFPDIQNAKVDWICAGFSHSSVYIRNWGIVIWQYASQYHEIESGPASWKIPSSSDWTFLVEKSVGNDHDIGKVIKHILLEQYVVFITGNGKLFCSSIHGPPTFEVPEINNVIDIQGSFRSFGVFKKDGSVIIISQDFLEQCENRATDRRFQGIITLPIPIPALQNSGVVQLAFGDYHFHALHSNGRITSYGKDPGSSGALGLYGIQSRAGTRVRGLRIGFSDATLLPHAYFTGRSVWFSEAKHKWLSALTAAFTSHPIEDEGKLGEFSEWVEQRGSNWEDIPEVEKMNKDGLGSHFALSVAAGGWSSGALLLVNEEIDKELERLCPPPPLEKLPNIQFSDGTWSMPGEQTYEWKKEPPAFNIQPGDGELWGVNGWVLDEQGNENES